MESKQFTFDAVFSEKSSQRKIYDVCGAPIIESVLEGYNGTMFVYGQTGAGKSFTMEGVPTDPELRGIIPNAFQHIFDHIALKESNETYLVRASYFEIYNEEIRDLLSSTPKDSLELKESPTTGVYVKGLSSHVVKSFEEIDAVMQRGKANRSVGATLMNAGSSRSHSVFTIVIERSVRDENGDDHIRVGKLNLVDLAGSERQGKTGATGQRLKEATKINLSLSALGNVISALVDGKTHHVPYRDSKLTRILQDSLGGNTKTVMCANAGPAEYNYDETISTLRYASRAKKIQNKPIINEDPKDTMLRELQDEIAKLKNQLQGIEAQEEQSVMTQDRGKSKLDQSGEMEKLEEKLRLESQNREEIERQKKELHYRLQDMEAQLMIGGAIADKSAKQEAELRKAEFDLIAKQEAQVMLNRQIAEQEEEKLLLTEQYSSLQEACQSLTKKLKVLSKKYKGLKKEVKDLNAEFETERADLLDTIRVLDKESALKALMIENFIPPEFMSRIESQATWDENKKAWTIPKLEYAGNNIVTKIPKFKKNSSSDKNIKGYENDFNLDLHFPKKSSRSMNSRSEKVDPTLREYAFIDKDREYCPYLWAKKK